MKNIFLALLLSLLSLPLAANAQTSCVILLHGLGKSSGSMEKMEKAIAAVGFTTVNVSYPSTDHPIEELAGPAIAPALDQCRDHDQVNFVTHSLGGILVRQYLSQVQIENLNRVVMLGPPNKGSEVVDNLGGFPGFHFILGDAGLQLGTGALSVPNKLGAAEFNVGIIAGTRSINLILSQMVPDTDDGKVSVESTKLEGMNDHLEMPVTHVFMMKNKKVIDQVIHYLKNGEFSRQ
ncbi:esterase/lipase family protein [Microbulbifer rhizosphaerae]|uniref:Pimeloyl-ACP methyl ester carboxylesterase n=1 Tax=Microbulbifer rhizosphaerae TaxID=1562603 RepID=A0A7W4Z817_9GAMM|nr:alpha/beta hydrolase [Microbulbifer rhizosphaerae]MBB3060328.1 pimeloyl-ACP methyl ester carboxylesterase [Microbulbifer rhizosphaerae]